MLPSQKNDAKNSNLVQYDLSLLIPSVFVQFCSLFLNIYDSNVLALFRKHTFSIIWTNMTNRTEIYFFCRQISFSLFTSSCKQVLEKPSTYMTHIIPINTQNLSLRDQTFGQIVKNQERKIVHVCFLWLWERERDLYQINFLYETSSDWVSYF
jgi:hypothetical protein